MIHVLDSKKTIKNLNFPSSVYLKIIIRVKFKIKIKIKIKIEIFSI